jgi:tetratricopeptide (TPR) repeat protein
MKIVAPALFISSFLCMIVAHAQQNTPAEQKIAAARQQVASDPKKPEAYNSLALALLGRANETASPDYDRQADKAIADGLKLDPENFQLRKTHVALLLDQHEFGQARDEAKNLNLHNPDDATVRGYMAQADIGLGNFDEAESATQWMLNLQPFNVPGLLLAAELRRHYGDADGALELLERASAETAPGETAELAAIDNRIASVEIDAGNLKAAGEALERAEQVFPGYPETAGNRARTDAGQHVTKPLADRKPAKMVSTPVLPTEPVGTPAAATPIAFSPIPDALLLPHSTATQRTIQNLQKRVERNPKDPSAYTALGAAYFQRARETGDVEDFQSAEGALDKSLALDKSDFSAATAYSTMAEVCMGEHRFSDAVAYAQKALALGSGDLSPFAIVGDANADMGEYERAAVAYTRLEIGGPSADAHTIYVRDSRIAYLKFVSGDAQGAIRLMQGAVAAGMEAQLPAENLAWLYYELGEFEFQAGDSGAANNAYLAALNIHPGDYRALAGLAKLRAAYGRYADAIKLYQSAIAIVPMPVFVAELGDVYAKAGNLSEAKKQYQLVEYIGLLGHINQVLHNRDLALFYADHDIKLQESLALARKEFEVRHDIYTWDALAWALYKNGEYQQASDAMQHALAEGARDALLFFHAGMIAGGLGQTSQARERLETALSINPQFHVIYSATAREQLKLLERQTGLTASQGQPHVP